MRLVDLVSHLGIQACECELEAVYYPAGDWFGDHLRKMSRTYRESQYGLLDIQPERDGLPYLAVRQ